MKDIPFISLDQAAVGMDQWGMEGRPFVFICDYKGEKVWWGSEEEAKHWGISLEFNSYQSPSFQEEIQFEKFPLSYKEYLAKFYQVQAGLKRGDSFLVNLTSPTPIQTNLRLEDIYRHAKAKYKLLIQDQVVVFSPEPFIHIENNKIQAFPMKGTLAINEKNHPEDLRIDAKEQAEHATIVDLIRNDISRVAYPIQVEKYQYIEEVKTHSQDLWQMSSLISGELMPHLKNRFGSILKAMLPAGSITGAPKVATMDIIEKAEGYDRGFYTGIMGKFDGTSLDSGVLIRFIEQINQKLVFKSGGGITVFSDPEKEYLELIQKIYLPI
ncbi:aminodeoxychorismate synthase component I [Cytophagaceae bacterium 50C-KIRBA]|uniref:Aminodeoxychorismate synthase component I n=1 Tax=Aquirufa beregesia TaxID=2516556 RepID=A0ABX0EUE9_9BACT|nr:aminodeoxychorismate synthase component I [Aquirufa beregesia]NGZ42978.1 aminodeoxychorismate synthase component I [Aquirufa beregesia]